MNLKTTSPVNLFTPDRFFIAFILLLSFSGFAQNRINSGKKNQNTISEIQKSPEKNKLSIKTLGSSKQNEAVSNDPVKNDLEATTGISPLDAMKGKREDTSKRDTFSKHFANNDGSYTAIIGSGPVHYAKDGKYYDINHDIQTNIDVAYPYANKENLFESYFGATSHDGIKNKTAEGEIKEFLNTKMYWEVNGQAVNTTNSINASITIQGEKAYYNNMYGNISAEFIIESGRRKLNYVVPNTAALHNVPVGANYLVFSENIVLPYGWTYKINQRHGILILDNNGKTIYNYENPVSTDAASDLYNGNTIYNVVSNNNVLTIETKVKTSWLLDASRQFPVKVDPTVSYYPNASTHRTAQLLQSGAGAYGNYAVGYSGGFYRSYASFDVTGIPDSATINTVVLNHNVGAQTGMTAGTFGSEIRSFLTDPESASYPNWIDVYNAVINATNSPTLYVTVSNLNTTGLKNVTLGTTANTDLRNALTANKFTVSYRPAGTYTTTPARYAQFYGDTDATRKPYLTVTYTEANVPPSCATLLSPANGATDTGHQGILSWSAVGGATSYDVYFGTGSNPSIVSTSQTGTTYNPGGCLLPNTQYYWKVVPKNANGSATGCTTWSFTTDGKLTLYKNDWETANVGFFGTSGTSVDGWFTNNNTGTGGGTSGFNNTWTVGTGANAISGKSVGVSALNNNALAGNYFQYYPDLGEIHRWIYRPFDMRGLRDIEVTFRWKAGGENNQDYGSVISSVNSGTNWAVDTQGGLNNDGKYWNSPSTIRTQSITLPATRNNQQNFVLGFKWDDLSGNSLGIDPTFVVDDIVIKACPSEGTIASNVVAAGTFEWTPTTSTQATLTINGSHTCAQFQWEQSTDGANWTNVTGGSGSTTVSYATPSNLAITTWYRAKVYFGTGCTGVYQDAPFKIIVIPTCTAEITSVTSGSACTDITLIAVGAAGTTTYNWYDASTGGNLVHTVSTGVWVISGLTATTTYYVAANNGTCESPRVAVTATPTPTSAVVFAQDESLCVPGIITLSAETNDDAIYTVNWYDAETGGTPLHNGFTYTPTITQTTTFYAAAVDGDCESERIAVTVTLNAKIWNGSQNTAWNNNANWTPAGIPTSEHCVVIPQAANSPIIANGIEANAKSLTLEENSSLLVQTGGSIIVVQSVVLAENAGQTIANLTLENNAYLKQTQNVATNNNIGKITVHRNSTPMFRLEATGWSSPVENQKLFDFAIGTLSNRIYEYDEPSNAFINTGITANSTFEGGKGYSIRSPNTYPNYTAVNTPAPVTFNGVFYGKPNNGDVGINITTNSFGFNYVGNPYPSPIDAYTFLDDNQTIDALYFWTHEAPPINSTYTANNYASFNGTGGTVSAAGGEEPDGTIQVGQGFVVRTASPTLLQFTNGLRTSSSDGQFFRQNNNAGERHRMWLNLSDGQTNFNQILIGYVTNATMGKDHQIDAKLFSYTGSSIYSLIDSERFVIQGRSLPFDTNDVVPMGFRATEAGMYTINIDHVDGLFNEGQTIYLNDLLLNTTHNLSESAYSFLAEPGIFNNRFEIVYRANSLSVSNPELNNNWIVYKNDNLINIKSNGFNIEKVEIYDLTGRLLMSERNINSETFSCTANFAQQVLLVKVNDTLVKKVL